MRKLYQIYEGVVGGAVASVMRVADLPSLPRR